MVIFAVTSVCAEEDRHLLFREDFNDLKNWDALYFLKIKKHSVYTCVLGVGINTRLRTVSIMSGGAGIMKKRSW